MTSESLESTITGTFAKYLTIQRLLFSYLPNSCISSYRDRSVELFYFSLLAPLASVFGVTVYNLLLNAPALFSYSYGVHIACIFLLLPLYLTTPYFT